MKKRLFCLFLALVMLMSLVACAAKEEAPAADAPAADAPAADAPAADAPAADAPAADAPESTEPVTLRIWVDGNQVEALEYATSLYNKYTGSNINFVVEEMASADLLMKIAAAAESGYTDDMADIAVLQNEMFVGSLYNYSDMFYPLDDYFTPDDFSKALLDFTTLDGAHYGIPKDTGYSISLYRTDLLEAGGLTAEDLNNITWEEFIEIGEKFYEDTGVYLMTDSWNSVLNEIWCSTEANYFDEDGSAMIDENKDMLADVISTYVEAVERNAVLQTAGSGDSVSLIANGTAAGICNGLWCQGIAPGTAPDLAGGWSIANVPSLYEGSANYSMCGGSSWCVFSSSANPEEAAKFLGYMYAGPGLVEDDYEFMRWMAVNRGEFLVHMPSIETGFYATYEDPYYGAGFWADVVTEFNKVPSTGVSPLYTTIGNDTEGLFGLAQKVLLEGADVYDVLDDFQKSLDFNFEG